MNNYVLPIIVDIHISDVVTQGTSVYCLPDFLRRQPLSSAVETLENVEHAAHSIIWKELTSYGGMKKRVVQSTTVRLAQIAVKFSVECGHNPL